VRAVPAWRAVGLMCVFCCQLAANAAHALTARPSAARRWAPSWPPRGACSATRSPPPPRRCSGGRQLPPVFCGLGYWQARLRRRSTSCPQCALCRFDGTGFSYNNMPFIIDARPGWPFYLAPAGTPSSLEVSGGRCSRAAALHCWPQPTRRWRRAERRCS
jgi:hypothetical protein